MSGESETAYGKASNFSLCEHTKSIGLSPLLKSISQDSFEIQLRNTASCSNIDSIGRLILFSRTKKCTCAIHRVLLQVLISRSFISYDIKNGDYLRIILIASHETFQYGRYNNTNKS